MIDTWLKRVAAALPRRWQQRLKRRHFRSHIRRDQFLVDDPEASVLDRLVSPGDWAVDVGANVGHYCIQIARIVGPSGRVVAFEPLPDSFEILASNVREAGLDNVTLLNAAASDSFDVQGMEVPFFPNGLPNTYMARLSQGSTGLQVLCIPVDAMAFPRKIRLVKVDAEGHDLSVLRGMSRILEQDQPRLIVEDKSDAMVTFLRRWGYRYFEFPASPNRVFYVGERPF